MGYVENLQNFVKKMEENLNVVHKQSHALPKGSLIVYKDGKYIRFVLAYKENGKVVHKGIGTRPDLVRQLSYKAYLQEKAKRLNADITLMKSVMYKLEGIDHADIKMSLPKNYSMLPEEYFFQSKSDMLHPVFTKELQPKTLNELSSQNLAEWQYEPYCANTKEARNLRILTNHGFYVRSKSEATIVDIYIKYGIRFHYDEVIQLGSTYISPDFISLRDDGKVIFHEHFGLMSNPDYVKAYYNKLELYRNFGIVPWNNLIVSYDDENGGINLGLLEEEIKSKLVDYASTSILL